MMLTSYTAAADTLLGVYAGAQGWDMAAEGNYGFQNEELNYRFEDETQNRFYIALEHPIPVIPNIKIAQSYRGGGDDDKGARQKPCTEISVA